jgi:hypothetical protein
MTKTPKIKVGSTIEWTSGAGVLFGTVSEIYINYAANGQMVPWMFVDNVVKLENGVHIDGRLFAKRSHLNANHGYMVMMKMKIDGIPVVTI